ncbi:geranylgeranyl transferase type-2 subunit alpha, partial [Tremellales sp. Uapishka_1]
MHGVKRSRIAPEAAEAKRLKELSKIDLYTLLQDDVLSRKRAKEYTHEALKRTTEMLDLNPEFYTIWNYRRQILLHGLFPSTYVQARVARASAYVSLRPPTEIMTLLSSDLRLTMAYLKVHPKVYWIWNHRKWCLENVPLGPGEAGTAEGDGWRNECWKVELMVVEKMLDADSRNFHAWDYRRYILASLPPSFLPARTPRDELAYTTKKIESNFSNFSAWHCRTKILGGLWESLSAAEVLHQKDQGESSRAMAGRRSYWSAEFELVTQALWTDPADLSGWLYHRWLVGTGASSTFALVNADEETLEPKEDLLRRELQSIQDLHKAEPDSKWCLNAVSHYTLLLSRLPSTSEEEQEALRGEAKAVLKQLEEVDSDRKKRYADLGTSTFPSRDALLMRRPAKQY